MLSKPESRRWDSCGVYAPDKTASGFFFGRAPFFLEAVANGSDVVGFRKFYTSKTASTKKYLTEFGMSVQQTAIAKHIA